jgi:hypothetical protein
VRAVYLYSRRKTAASDLAQYDDLVTVVDHAFGIKTRIFPGLEHACDRLVEAVGAPPSPRLDRVRRVHPLDVFGQQPRVEPPAVEQLLEDAAKSVHVLLRHRPPSIPPSGEHLSARPAAKAMRGHWGPGSRQHHYAHHPVLRPRENCWRLFQSELGRGEWAWWGNTAPGDGLGEAVPPVREINAA